MNLSDINVGDTVYHRIYHTWGAGKVIAKTVATGFEAMFEKGRHRIVVQFEGHEEGNTTRVKPQVIRKTPDRKRIKEMIEFYKGRGVVATELNGRVILGERAESEVKANPK